MKDLIVNKLLNIVKKYNFYNSQLEEIKYGLLSIYILITKTIIIILVAYILNIFNETLVFIVLYNIIRLPSFGLHATKSWICLLSSLLVFITLPLVSLYFIFHLKIKIIISIICLLLMFKNSPSDTNKRPIISPKRRLIYKWLSVLISIIYSFLLIFTNNFISNCLILSLVLQCFMISPLVYKIFNLPYNNYKNHL